MEVSDEVSIETAVAGIAGGDDRSPGAGELALAGNGLKSSSATATGAGEVTLSVKAAGKAKQKLRRKGKKTFQPSVTFTAAGGAPNTESTSVKLVRR